jgi:hypothetical protein
MNYREEQYQRVGHLLANGDTFAGDAGNGLFRGRCYPFILQDGDNNLYAPCRDAMKEYFKANDIAWWGGGKVTPHPLSSQAACLNHLFPLRDDKEAALVIIQQIDPTVTQVLSIETDEKPHSYVAFEAVSDGDHLNELSSTRGSNCTSVDALIVGRRDDGSVVLFPLEWKYTEFYGKDDKAAGSKGQTRKGRYEELIDTSGQLIAIDHSVYYFEPFYQLMRQTLWAEQMVAHRNNETIKTVDYIHIHVIPTENRNLLQKSYPCGGKGMEDTWRGCLRDQSKYRIISPQHLLAPVDRKQHGALLDYLARRYWDELI